jgi:hypothetical protein
MTLKVKNWSEIFEPSQLRRNRGPLSWVGVPTKHDGKGYRRLMKHANGAALYGAWMLLLQVAAKCQTRGVLADDDGPLTSEDLELKTGCPAVIFDEAISVLTDPKIGWLIVTDPCDKPDGAQSALGDDSEHSGSALGESSDDAPRPCIPPDQTRPDRTRPDQTQPVHTRDGSSEKSGSGKSAKRSGGKNPFDSLSDAKLRDTKYLVSFHRMMVNFEAFGIQDTEAELLEVIGAAERSLEKGDTPVRMFIAAVKRRDWSKTSSAQIDRANDRLHELRRGDGPPAEVANLLAGIGKGGDAA